MKKTVLLLVGLLCLGLISCGTTRDDPIDTSIGTKQETTPQVTVGNQNTDANTEPITETEPETEIHTHSYGEWVVIQNPDCYENGLQSRSCACGDEQTEEILTDGHTVVTIPGITPTCTNIGLSDIEVCSVCGYEFGQLKTLKPTGHTLVTDLAKAPSCTESGLTEGKHCSVCGYVSVPQEVLDNAHEVPSWTVHQQPTLIEAGSRSGVCTLCDETVHQTLEPLYSQGLAYTIRADGTCEITGIGTCTDTVLSIPPSIEGYRPTVINFHAFANNTDLTAVILPNTMKDIRDYAFIGCSNLTSIILPDSIVSIGSSAFTDCVQLASVTIPKSVAEIGNNPFPGCIGLTEILVDPENQHYSSFDGALYNADQTTLISAPGGKSQIAFSSTVTVIDTNAFRGCTNLASITIPDQVTAIESMAFLNCTGLSSLTIGSGVTTIGRSAFQNCSALKTVVIPDSVTSVHRHAFKTCSSLTSLIIGDGVVTIGEAAFEECPNLLSVTIGTSVTQIDLFAFEDSTHLVEVINHSILELPGSSFPANGGVADYALEIHNSESKLINADGYIFYPYNGTYYLVAYMGNDTHLVLPQDCQGQPYVIHDYAFSNSIELQSVIIPDSVTSIGKRAFMECRNLTSVTIGNGVTAIGELAFATCTSLESLTIGSSITEIGSYAFRHCNQLTTILLPESLTFIGSSAFESCTALTSIIIPDNVTIIEGAAFNECTSLASVNLGNGVTSLGGGVFDRCKSLTSIYIPASVTEIAETVFTECTALTAITVDPENPNYCSVGGALYNKDATVLVCYPAAADEINLPAGVTTIGYSSFDSCKNLTFLVLPEGVTSIHARAFNECSNLTGIVIPKSATEIQDMAFYHCRNLRDIYYVGTQDEWFAIQKSFSWDDYMGDYSSNDYTLHYNYQPA